MPRGIALGLVGLGVGAGGVAVERFDLYVDYKNGDDVAGDGSLATPYKTLSKALSVAIAGQSIGLMGDATADAIYWGAGGTSALDNITIKNVSGHTPTFNLATLKAPGDFAKTGGYTNVYEATVAAFAVYGVWHGSTELAIASSVANCDATTNSFYRVNGGGNTLYINVGGSAPTETVTCNGGGRWLALTGDNVTVQGISVLYGEYLVKVEGTGNTLKDLTQTYQRSAYGRKVIEVTSTATGCTLDGITFVDWGKGGGNVYGLGIDGADCTIKNCDASDGGYQFIRSTAANTIVEYTTVADCRQDGIIFGGVNGIARYCITIDCIHAGIFFPSGADGGLAHHCIAYATGSGPYRGLLAEQAAGQSCAFYHCTVFGITTPATGQGILIQTNGTVTLRNCIFHGNNVGIHVNLTGYTPTLDLDYNCVQGNTTNYSNTSAQAHDVAGDPLFTDDANADFTLESGSPCRGAGETIAGISEQNPATIGRWEYAV